mgnify:CR=1 FL=1|jgi:hypothetical protein
MIKKKFKIRNRQRTFLTIPLAKSGWKLLHQGQESEFYEESELSREIVRLQRSGHIDLVWKSFPVSKDSGKTGKVEVKKSEKAGAK